MSQLLFVLPKTVAREKRSQRHPLSLPVLETTLSGNFPRIVQRQATGRILSESRDRQRLASDIHDRLWQLRFLTRLHLGQAQRPSFRGHTSSSLTLVDQMLEESLAFTRLLIDDLTPAGLRTGELISALDMLALEMCQKGYQVHMTVFPSKIRLSEPIPLFVYRAISSFFRQTIGEDNSPLVTVSVEGTQASIVRVRAAVDGKPRSSEAEAVSLFEQTMDMTFAGIQACSKLLGILMSVKFSPETTSALVLAVPLLGAFDPR